MRLDANIETTPYDIREYSLTAAALVATYKANLSETTPTET